MLRAVSYAIPSIVPSTILLLILCSGLFGQVNYDCPSQVPAITVDSGTTHKIVEMLIPVSIAIEDTGLDVNDVNVQVKWNRNAYPVVEFAPKTLLQSNIDGAISIEKKTETNYGIGVDVGSDYLEFFDAQCECEHWQKRLGDPTLRQDSAAGVVGCQWNHRPRHRRLF